ncbi:LytTR family DNA-binding domain-containing protein [Novosphingobium olei]|uniref:LytTR family DNA-binding domain-containing protein n=1 Tax=Novosphingobium olei TaxID=2728851 RepID=UPI00308BA268|nr:LytTR family transcriptional regulator [Novosphingobium olei]
MTGTGNFADAPRLTLLYRSRSMNGTYPAKDSRKPATKLAPGLASRLAGELAIMMAAALVLALLGPFGMFAMSLPARLLAWAIFAIGGYACFRPVLLAGDALAEQTGLSRWIAITLACALAAMPTTLIVAGTLSGLDWQGITARDLIALYPQVLIVGGMVTVVQLLANRQRAAPVEAAEPVAEVRAELPVEQSGVAQPPLEEPPALAQEQAPVPQSGRIALFDQLPAHLGQDLLCIENEDHYIRVHTSAGNALILMRLRDAVAQLAPLDGAQVHRSWWVARSAVSEVVRTERRVSLRLVDGREVPVSRSSVPELRARGWL